MLGDSRIDALYGRQSVDKKDSISIESQLEFCRYETHGSTYEEYTDKGFSGKNTNRPDFERMMGDIEKGKIKRVIVYKLDRISRSILDFANMMEVFQQYNVEFVSSTEKFDTSTPIGRAMLNICIVFAQLERETIQKRVTDAYYSRSIKGYYMGGRVPYGFKLEKTLVNGIKTSYFIPDGEKASHVIKMYHWYAEEGKSLGEIQRKLMETDCGDKKWCTARISEIIRNPVYVKADIDIYNFFKSQGSIIINPASEFIGTNGLFLFKGRNADGTKKKQYDLVNREVVLAPHEGLVDSRIWLKCRQKIMNNRQLAETRGAKNSWLVGKIKCKKCGYAYIVTKNSSGTRYFQCSGARYVVKCPGIGKTIYAEEMEQYIYGEMKKILTNLEYVSPEKKDEKTHLVSSYEMKIAEKDKEISALLDKLAFANDALTNYINQRVQELDKSKRELLEKMLQISSSELSRDIEKITDYVEKWDELITTDKQKIVDILIKVIYIGNEEIEIEWNI